MCDPSRQQIGDEDVIKTTETSLGQNITIGTADEEDEPTTSTLAGTADDVGTNVGNCSLYLYFYVPKVFVFPDCRSNTYANYRSLNGSRA